MSGTLLFNPEPYKGESVRGFLLRIVEANVLERSSWLKNVPLEAERIRSMIGPILQGRAPDWLHYTSVLEKGSSPYQRLTGVRCCPECLIEHRYWRFEWEHILYVVCHHHRRRMHDRCPSCMSKLIWERSELLRCRCGSAICDWHLAPVASDEEVELCSHIATALAEKHGGMTGDVRSDFYPVLSSLSLRDLETLIVTFGAYGERLKDIARSGPRRFAEIDDAHKLVRVAADMLMDWPQRFNAVLRELGGYDQPDAQTHEPSREFQNFVRVIRNRFNTTGLAFVVTAYRNFIFENWYGVLNRRQKWMDDERLDAQRYITAGIACTMLGTSRRHVRQLMDQNILRGYVTRTPNQREFIVVERDSLANAKALLDDHIPLASAAKLLGLPKGRVCELVVAGLLPEIKQLFTPDRICRFSRNEIAAFIKRLSAGKREPSEEEELISATTVLKTHLASAEEFCSLVRSILAREIATIKVSSSTQGFADLTFARVEFYKWRSKLRLNDECPKVTVVKAADRLGVKQEVAYHLVRTGLLPSLTTLFGKRICRLVCLDDIEAFEALYVSASYIASIEKISARAMVKNFQANGIFPIVGPSIDGCRQYFFRRKDVVTYSLFEANVMAT